MRLTLKIFALVLILTKISSAQQIVADTTDVGLKIYLYASEEDVIVVGKVIDLAVIELQLMNFNPNRILTFDPEKDHLYIQRFDANIKAALYDYAYLDNKIYPGHQMALNFYLPRYKDITANEFYFITYNGTLDTLTIAPTIDDNIALYVRKYDKAEERRWYWKLGQTVVFGTAAILAYRLF